MLAWLDGKLPVPKIIAAETQDDTSHLLMSRLPGEMACSAASMRNIEATVKALAQGLQMLWQIDTSDCPCSNQNRPSEDLIFSHGDFCLPNIFISGSEVTGFLDLGSGGVSDRWQDIALCVRSLQYNMIEYANYTEADYQQYRALLFQELGITPDEEKIQYYILLDELF